jgi:hypothetical protein
VGHSRVSLKSLLGCLDLNEAWRREVRSSIEYLKVFAMWNEWPTMLERPGGSFIALQENLAIGCQKLEHVWVRGRICPTTVSETWLLSRIRLRVQTCLAWGADMSDQSLWNPVRGSDISGLTGVFSGRVDFWCFTLHQLTQCIPLDSTELLELK